MSKITKYLEQKLGASLFELPPEQYTNSREKGIGIRFVVGGTNGAFRLNWSGSIGDINQITGIDIWNGTSHDPNAHIAIEAGGHKLDAVWPALVDHIKNPTIGELDTVLAEAPKRWTPEVLAQTAVQFIQKNPDKVSKMAFAGVVGYNNSSALEVVIEMYDEWFEQAGKSRKFVGPADAEFDVDAIAAQIKDRSVSVYVERGGSNETYGETEAEKAVEDVDADRIPYQEQLEHMKSLVTAVAKKAITSLIIAGSAGAGKSFSVLKTLEENGLTDGNGMHLQVGTASALGLYALAYNHQDEVIVLDDADSALMSLESQNLLKNLLDSKKERKISWGTRSSMLYDPDTEDVDPERDGVDKFPNYFYFTGQMIIISNLTPKKLDPTGALSSRSYILNIAPTRTEVFDQMEKIIDKIPVEGANLTSEERHEVLDVLKQQKDGEMSIRKLVRSLALRAAGVPNWSQLCRLYA